MVVAFKMKPGRQMIFPIDPKNIEDMIGRNWPWFVAGIPPDVDRHHAVCPYCDNPVRIKALYRRTDNSPRPYGQHTGVPQPGFFFDAIRHKHCPYVLKKNTRPSDERRAFDPMAEELIQLTVSEFDRIILILEDDYGFPISVKLAEEMLRGWFGLQGYLYTGAHLRNVPWMVGYFGGSAALYGRKLGANPDLVKAITDNVAGAIIDHNGQLLRDGPQFKVTMQTLHHRTTFDHQALIETMAVRVQDYTRANEPSKAPTLHTYQITFDPEKFEALMNTAPSRAYRNEKLLQIAQKVEMEYR
jgi:hypothetical protein